jgi:hypothetical protein
MQSAIALFPKSSLERPAVIAPAATMRSGFFETIPDLADSTMAAAVVLALHRGLIAESEREYLPLRVSK